MTFATQASAADNFWIIVYAMNTSDDTKNISGTVKFLDKKMFQSQRECEQYLLADLLLEYDEFYAEKDTLGERLVIRQKPDNKPYFATTYTCDSIN